MLVTLQLPEETFLVVATNLRWYMCAGTGIRSTIGWMRIERVINGNLARRSYRGCLRTRRNSVHSVHTQDNRMTDKTFILIYPAQYRLRLAFRR